MKEAQQHFRDIQGGIIWGVGGHHRGYSSGLEYLLVKLKNSYHICDYFPREEKEALD